jgi:predicted TIM-barrel fold metal-dependent hydrolase
MIPTTPPSGAKYNDPAYDKLWAAAVAHGMPVSLHVGTGALPQAERGPGGAVINYAKVGLLAADTLCYLAAGGALDRFPELHIVFVESGGGWLAYCCERMDEAFREHHAFVSPELSMPPGELVRRQCHVTLGADRSPILNLELTGAEPLMWASDYPHPEGTFPESQAVIERIFRGVPDDVVDQIVGANAAAVYGISLAS